MLVNARFLPFVMAFGALLVGGCTGATSADDTPNTPVAERSSTASPPAALTPAKSPATVSGALPSVRLVRAFPALPALPRPVAMLEVEPGWFVVALQEGKLVGFAAGAAADIVTYLDHTANTSRGGNEEGLLSFALDPDFARNGYLYVYYSAATGERRTVLSRFESKGKGASWRVLPESELVILAAPQPFGNHKGGTVLFGPEDDMLYLGLGDGGGSGDSQGNGQDITRNLLASIIRIDVRGVTAARPYRIPADNPFASEAAGQRPETWAYGFRNPWRMSFDRAAPHGLWAGDVGQNAVEEVDRVVKGANYGWNLIEGTRCFRPPSGCDTAGLTLPVAEYGQGGSEGDCSVTGGFVYRGRSLPSLAGAYLFSDYCSGTLRALREPYASRPAVEVLEADGPQAVSFAEDRAGELYLLGADGHIYALTAGP